MDKVNPADGGVFYECEQSVVDGIVQRRRFVIPATIRRNPFRFSPLSRLAHRGLGGWRAFSNNAMC